MEKQILKGEKNNLNLKFSQSLRKNQNLEQSKTTKRQVVSGTTVAVMSRSSSCESSNSFILELLDLDDDMAVDEN